MQISATGKVNVVLDENEQYKVSKEFLENLFGYERGCYVDGENLVLKKVLHTTHSWNETEILRKATKEDILYFEFMKLLKEKNKNN